ncbi:YdeI/OmpD-associated family protein [Algoriphagus pacificus]|uniref:YdeI/OmpD-associated family protein n=1 Tax=Algoriphagus pacificus TaxID=2811234 RepID=A0ABS3CE74_9BACT|nr:YdeI/OmpD-associated family protein [Algoriphagus pacificus]MBN7815404.1 YdeI/OmpD-associated family protein [Algoriphagus pacificus]
MNTPNPAVDFFFDKPSQWQNEYKKLRQLALKTGLVEELKWGVPCYTYHGANVVLIHGFKEYCALLFHKGALLQDDEQLLIQQTKNVQAARQLRFSDLEEIKSKETAINAYIYQAIEVEKAGLKVELKETKEYEIPDELKEKFDSDPSFKEAFESLTPGRQRGYLLHFSAPKQAKTRESRIEKSIPSIKLGKGLND